MHPIVYWDPKFEKLTDMDLAKHIIQSYIDGMREQMSNVKNFREGTQ